MRSTVKLSGYEVKMTLRLWPKADAAYIDIFSRRPYDPDKVAKFSKTFFRAASVGTHVTKRM